MGAVLAIGLLASPAQAATDLPKSHSFFDEMNYLVKKGVISGFEDGSLKPDKTVSRAEAAIMIGKLKGFDGTQSATKFKDVTKISKRAATSQQLKRLAISQDMKMALLNRMLPSRAAIWRSSFRVCFR